MRQNLHSLSKQNVLGCLYGAALGDALGAATEFLSVPKILARFPPHGPQEPPGNPARVTDDTQMALAVGDALVAAPLPYAPESLSKHLRAAFVRWLHDPENNRAPGRTCITACHRLERGENWVNASVINSKGCGANMRVMPVAFLGADAETRSAIAQFQAAHTHGHPTALAASDLTTFVIVDLASGQPTTGLLARVRQYAESQRRIYHQTWLGDLWTRFDQPRSAEAYIERGWEECLDVVRRVEAAAAVTHPSEDPCQPVGEGWIAEEAFGVALLCFLMFPNDPVSTIRRAAVTAGDSDSIACIAGAFAGAYHGIEAWPSDWIERIEYREQLLTLGEALFARASRKRGA